MSLTISLTPEGLESLLAFCSALDLSDPEEAKRRLDEAYPVGTGFTKSIELSLCKAMDKGSLLTHGEPPLRFGRLFKACDASHGFSADAVLMSGIGPRHRHPKGEIDLCFCVGSNARFDGKPAGWTVYSPGSEHAPTVTAGEMIILYLLPGGAIDFKLDA